MVNRYPEMTQQPEWQSSRVGFMEGAVKKTSDYSATRESEIESGCESLHQVKSGRVELSRRLTKQARE